tara:strand:- start:321 stop:2906 length:2586 start_codon:yes stop_codon:yes gene_type:complete
MAFKKNTFSQNAASNPAAHFKTLTKRQYPDVMPHQKEMLESYAANYESCSDIALQLPTGSGKTLVGLLIADWRRIKNGDRVVYLCPTRQLVHQTALQAKNQYGIDVVDLSGKKDSFPPADVTAYKTGAQVAVTTYSGLFNTHPFFEDPNVVIVDDAHSAENYIAKMWSLKIPAQTPLHDALGEFLRPHLDPQDHARLMGDWKGPEDSTWVEKIPVPVVTALAKEICDIIDAHADRSDPELYFTWSILRDHLDACHIYLESREILIRPLIPPTSTHAPFAKANQRIFMSATLGAGGDLERLTGRQYIERLPAPDGFQSAGVGRRFFIFPSLSLTGEETDGLRAQMQQRAGRSVILTPSTPQADAHQKQIEEQLEGFEIYTKDDIEADKAPFVQSKQAIAILANRYDGIDFPGEECRLLCVDGYPKAMNAQERFIMSKMGATALYNERIQARVLQAVGRCTRALQDRSAVFVTGTSLVDFLADNRKNKYLHPEVQAELAFGVSESTNVDIKSIFENFNMFMENNADWSSADATIRNAIPNISQDAYPEMGNLEKTASHEVVYQEAIWNRDYQKALTSARTVLASLNHSNLRGYRALWHYLAGAAAFRLSAKEDDAQARAAREQFAQARAAAPSVSWLNTLARAVGGISSEAADVPSSDVLKQVEAIEQQFLKMGITTNHKFEKMAAQIGKNLADAELFEPGLVDLGMLLGFSSGNSEVDAAPDPWWLGDKIGVVFEAHADGKLDTVFGADKARQASGHPKWIKHNVAGASAMDILSVLITPCTKAKSGADPQLSDVRYWRLDEFRGWAIHAVTVLRELKGTFPGEGDLVWRAEASQRLEAERMTLEAMIADRLMATDAMEIVA